MSNFDAFTKAINDHFIGLSKQGELYVTATTKDDLWQYYLSSYPEGTNPIHRTRRVYDCATCKSFIRNVGNVVAIIDNMIVSVWDVGGLEYPYDVVADAMGQYVKSKPIASIFRVEEPSYGAATTRQLLDDQVIQWHHFYGKITHPHHTSRPGQAMGDCDAIIQVMRRGLQELTLQAIDTVLELIEAKLVYRGEEHLPTLKAFRELKVRYDESDHNGDHRSPEGREVFLWSNMRNPVARVRNTAIGTLLQDISGGVEVEIAVASFGSKMEGYKRPKSFYTPSQGRDAIKMIQELGIESSLSRRFARISDISVNDVLFVDNAVRGQMRGGGGIASLVMSQAKGKAPNLDNSTPIGIEEFMSQVLPKASSVKVLLENRHLGNLVSLTAPTDPDAPGIFKWDNNFAWSYKDNVTDSIKQKVKAAGGNVTAPFRISLAWYNYDDLDIHVWEPGGSNIYFNNKVGRQGGVLDVDMNITYPGTRTPVENTCWTHPPDGTYQVQVHCYTKRESIDVGFTLEVESMGEISTYHYPLPVNDYVYALSIEVKGGKVISIVLGPGVEGGDSPKEEWGLKTHTLVPVYSIVLSPNHWGGQGVGNKHWFFLLHGCLNPEPTRGIYGEYLRDDLYTKHRKVFEVLGDLTKAAPTDDQLSGLGFSSTRRDKVRVLVQQGTASKAYEICF